MAHPLRTSRTTKSAIALSLLAAAAAALALPAATATTASDRETGTVKTTVVEASAGDKKVEVIKA
ncbi:hypothetical protein [Streptomyces sp. WAC01280]|uniref:hypothetical protein n=1 Tax=Streptomyces sp. WAC01280 TaxID=2487424 RepID=UPI000F78CC23|nr:hypothetical protein [Streptomyces sp. WAC01280]RSS53233.1 hypothetical protein EF909_27430 [Streptomyces sp. WAC01280]